MVAQELWAMLCVYQAVRHLATTSAAGQGIPPTRISFKHTLHAAQRTDGADFPPRRLTAKIRGIGPDEATLGHSRRPMVTPSAVRVLAP
ncbi:hypothetical protein ACTVZO_16965 [Streptomyces sp. IBSNAI002]|uniref:hypothetical protein n=1 Tax=Streptomyces sp. IBSNAI002 TaxID=3457500 RepID=UPI003FD19BE9